MLAAAIIVFREVLEAAIVISIVMAATRDVMHRGKWVLAGMTAGLAGAGLIALLANAIANMADGTGQELVNAGILFTAVVLLTWHIVWMNSHGRELAEKIKSIGHEVSIGAQHMSVLAIVVGLALMREGAEIVLLLQGLSVNGTNPAHMALAALGGLGVGAAIGFAMYAGFRVMPAGKMFTFTNWLLLLIAAGMAARGANYLVQAGFLSSMGDMIWDTSHILSEESLMGQLLATLVGYIARPSGIQILFYCLTIGLVTALMIGYRRVQQRTAAAMLVLTAIIALPTGAQAASVKSPYVHVNEFEVEHKGNLTNDNIESRDLKREFEFAASYGVTSWWKPEIEVEYEGEADESKIELKKYKFESTFQLADQDEYFVDPGFYVDYAIGDNGEADAVTYGLLLAKSVGNFSNKANLFVKHEFGKYAEEGTPLLYRWQTKYRYQPWLEPGFEIYGDTKATSDFDKQSLKMGPVIFGGFTGLTDAQKFKYELGYLFGVNRATPDGTLKWVLEYEFYF
jgi:high-affinity iron transporter